MYRIYLRAMGCAVRTASNGLKAIITATRHPPDAIVMDLAMPGVDGWSATKQLRRQRVTRDVPIVALSCVEFARAKARAAGCDAFLAKPCLPELLWWQVRTLLQSGRVHRNGKPRGRTSADVPSRAADTS